MCKDYEIEKKFLVAFPDLNKLEIKSSAEILQTYLKSTEKNNQKRVRKIISEGKIKYTYTEKVFITPMIRQEMEYEINESEYNRLIINPREDCVPIEKVRYCFDYKGQVFELDVYPFSDKLAILELELENPEQSIDFPDNVRIIKEVTDDSRYSNAALATAAAFPE